MCSHKCCTECLFEACSERSSQPCAVSRTSCFGEQSLGSPAQLLYSIYLGCKVSILSRTKLILTSHYLQVNTAVLHSHNLCSSEFENGKLTHVSASAAWYRLDWTVNANRIGRWSFAHSSIAPASYLLYLLCKCLPTYLWSFSAHLLVRFTLKSFKYSSKTNLKKNL